MHEIGYCEGILEAVLHRAKGRVVEGFTVRIGAAHRISKPALDQAFSLLSVGTVAEGAVIDLVTTPLEVACTRCRARAQSMDPLALCPSCGSAEVISSGGEEVLLESLDLQAAPPPAGA